MGERYNDWSDVESMKFDEVMAAKNELIDRLNAGIPSLADRAIALTALKEVRRVISEVHCY